MRRDLAAACLGLCLLAAPVSVEAVVSLGVEGATFDIPPAAIAEIEISESGGITDVFLRLMPRAAAELARLTGEAAAQTMTLRVCGATLMKAVVRDRIGSGTVYLAGTTMIRAEAMRALWHGRARCDTLGPEVFENGQ